jgi:hypothetical protein
MPKRQEIINFENWVLDAFDRSPMPMASVYMICARMGDRQKRSKSKFYVKVYRALERMVKDDKIWVMRGTRDPSVYMPRRLAKGFDKDGLQEIPF